LRADNNGIRIVNTIILCVFHSNGRGDGGNPTKSVVTEVVSETEGGKVRESFEESTEAKAGWAKDSY
jgi:hypothetical protein